MATTFFEKQQKQLLKKFYVLLGKSGAGTQGKEAILHSYGVESSRDLSVHDLMDICDKLTMQADPKLAEMDRRRKRVIRVIFAYYEATGKQASMDYVKATACRAAGYESFNRIPAERLNNLYNAFKDRIKDIKKVGSIVNEDLLNTINLN